ncbi:MAG: glycosyltransferase family 2 protein [Bacteroidetes bacterium]|nr:glycosyltransferase family 2 protein [Bacteroidota bacterium]
MHSTPKVSVIIPNYNHATFLQQRIDSVLNQTYNDIELIILDDCSTDDSKAIIEIYRPHPKVSHIIYNEANSGNPFIQWNRGIELAKGEYIWIAESDDWCEISLLETLLTGLEGNNRCVIGYCQTYCVNDDNSIKFQTNHIRLSEYLNGSKFINDYLLPSNPIINASMALWKKNIYNKITNRFLEYKLIGDYYFWIELCTYGDVFISGKILNYFRAHDKNVSFNSYENGLTYTERIPLLKDMLARKIIDEKVYMIALKKAYSLFKCNAKGITKENMGKIKKMFYYYSGSPFKLNLFYLKKSFQLKAKKWLRL